MNYTRGLHLWKAEGTYSNEGREVGRAEVAGGVHVEDRSAAAAGRPRLDAGVGVEVEVAAELAVEVEGEGDLVVRVAREGEGVGALAPGARGDLSEADHVGVENGEPSTQ